MDGVDDGPDVPPFVHAGEAPDGAGGPAPPTADAALRQQVRSALVLIRRLIDANLESINLAKDLMLAQEVADLHTARMHPAIDAAAASGGDAAAIEQAVAAVAAAEQANVAELTLAKGWGIHLGEVYSLIETAEGILDTLGAGLSRGGDVAWR